MFTRLTRRSRPASSLLARPRRRTRLSVESLESRTVLAAVVYVNDDFTQSNGTMIPDANPHQNGNQAAEVGLTAFATIQEAIDAVDPGGRVLITDDLGSDGAATYAENVTIDKDVRVIATDGDPSAVVVEGGGNGSVFTIGAYTVRLDSLTIQGGQGSGGGGVYNDGGDVTIVNSVITGNAATADVQTFTADLQTLNAAYGSMAQGTATLTLDTSGVTGAQSGVATLRVQIEATGLQDLSDFPDAVHVAHIRGQFAGNASRPLADQGDGPFFDGEGGAANGFPPVDSVLPSAEQDGDLNIDESQMFDAPEDYLDFFEGRPDYGPVLLNLTANQIPAAPDGVPPLTNFFNLVASNQIDPANEFPSGTTFSLDTTYTFDLSDQDERRAFNNLLPLESREIVLHGLTIPTIISDAIDAATGAQPGDPTAGVPLGDGFSFRRTAPVAAGEIVAQSTSGNGTGGGGVFNNGGTLVIRDSVISDNTAEGSLGSGGGVLSTDGQVTIRNTRIEGNEAVRAGGGIEIVAGSLNLVDSDLIDNEVSDTTGNVLEASPGNGGGLHVTSDATVSITRGTVSGNVAASEGGGLWNSATGTMFVNRVDITSNTASGDAADNGGGGVFNNGGMLVIRNSTISGNMADGDSGSGGGIFTVSGVVSINQTTVSDNTANRAGGGVEVIDGTVNIASSTLSQNVAGPSGSAAPGNGGALHVSGSNAVVNVFRTDVQGNTAASEGGGLWNQAGSTLRILASNVQFNEAQGTDADNGGGGVFDNGGVLVVLFSSISNNISAGDGGGLFLSQGADARIFFSQIANNQADGDGGGIYNDAELDLVLSVITQNQAGGQGGGLYNDDNASVDNFFAQIFGNSPDDMA